MGLELKTYEEVPTFRAKHVFFARVSGFGWLGFRIESLRLRS